MSLLVLLLFLQAEPATEPTCLDAVGAAGSFVNGKFDFRSTKKFATVVCVKSGPGKVTFTIALPQKKGGATKIIESPNLTVPGEETPEYTEMGSPIEPDGVRWKLRTWKDDTKLSACEFDTVGRAAICAFVGVLDPPG